MSELSRPSFVDLTDGSHDALALLRAGLDKSSGHVRIVVHPRYVNPQYPILTPEYLSNLGEHIDPKGDFVNSPLIVYEEENAMSRLHEVLGEREAFLVRTIKDYSVPATKILKCGYNAENAHLRSRESQRVTGLLRGAGIETVEIGGRCLYAINPGNNFERKHKYVRFLESTLKSPSNKVWRERGEYPSGCVGGVISRMMLEGVEVNISPAASPFEDPFVREDLKGIF